MESLTLAENLALMNSRHPLTLLLVMTLIAGGLYAADPKPAGKTLLGTVVSCEDSVLMVRTNETTMPVAVLLESDTQVYVNGQLAKLADIKAGGNVTVHQVDGLTKRLDIRIKKDGA